MSASGLKLPTRTEAEARAELGRGDVSQLALHWLTTAHPGAPAGNGHVYVVMAGGKKLASMWGPADLKVQAADLFAAAPELLAILEPFIEIWAKGGSDYEKRMQDYWRYNNLNRARAAIAKARGQS